MPYRPEQTFWYGPSIEYVRLVHALNWLSSLNKDVIIIIIIIINSMNVGWKYAEFNNDFRLLITFILNM